MEAIYKTVIPKRFSTRTFVYQACIRNFSQKLIETPSDDLLGKWKKARYEISFEKLIEERFDASMKCCWGWERNRRRDRRNFLLRFFQRNKFRRSLRLFLSVRAIIRWKKRVEANFSAGFQFRCIMKFSLLFEVRWYFVWYFVD